VPRTMIVALLTVLRLSLWTVRRSPLCRQIPLADRQESCQPEHGAAACEHLSDVLSRFRQHGRSRLTLHLMVYEDPPNSWNDFVTPKM